MYDDVAIELAERRNGLTTPHELRLHGVTNDEIRQLGRSRHWDQPTPRVLRRVGAARTTAQKVAIEVLDHGPDAYLSHLPGARHWGLTGCPRFPIHVVGTSASRRRGSSRTRYHRVRHLPPNWTTELDGIPVVRPELLALQLFAVCSYERAERLTDSLWSKRLLSGRSLRRFLVQMGRMGRNGTAGLRRYFESRPDDHVPPASGLESRTQQLLDEAGIGVRRQVDVGSDEAWTGRVDFLVDGAPVVVEIQSERYHAALVDRRADRRRRELLESAGFVWVEIWDNEVWSTPEVVAPRVRTAIRRSRTRPAL